MANYQHKLTDTLKFGKHKGQTIQWVIDNHPDYLEWAISKDGLEWFELDAEAEDALGDALDSDDLDIDYISDW